MASTFSRRVITLDEESDENTEGIPAVQVLGQGNELRENILDYIANDELQTLHSLSRDFHTLARNSSLALPPIKCRNLMLQLLQNPYQPSPTGELRTFQIVMKRFESEPQYRMVLEEPIRMQELRARGYPRVPAPFIHVQRRCRRPESWERVLWYVQRLATHASQHILTDLDNVRVPSHPKIYLSQGSCFPSDVPGNNLNWAYEMHTENGHLKVEAPLNPRLRERGIVGFEISAFPRYVPIHRYHQTPPGTPTDGEPEAENLTDEERRPDDEASEEEGSRLKSYSDAEEGEADPRRPKNVVTLDIDDDENLLEDQVFVTFWSASRRYTVKLRRRRDGSFKFTFYRYNGFRKVRIPNLINIGPLLELVFSCVFSEEEPCLMLMSQYIEPITPLNHALLPSDVFVYYRMERRGLGMFPPERFLASFVVIQAANHLEI